MMEGEDERRSIGGKTTGYDRRQMRWSKPANVSEDTDTEFVLGLYRKLG